MQKLGAFSFSWWGAWGTGGEMARQSSWFRVILPNLILAWNSVLNTSAVTFDQSYILPNQQLWIRFSDSHQQSFQGIWVTKAIQKKVHGTRSGNHYALRVG
ncbi:hypothetical protein EBR78_09735, partial [bacterium]|nr:hypothetical protein [bacterium]